MQRADAIAPAAWADRPMPLGVSWSRYARTLYRDAHIKLAR
jgi:hypothetical protein